MKIKTKKNYISAIFCMLCFVLCIISGTFSATVNAAQGGNASLTLNCVKDGEVISGMEWQIYHVADDLTGDKPKLTKSFNKYRKEITLGDGSLTAMSQLASTLKGYTLKGKIKPTQTAISDDEGKAKFTNLACGYYLITAKKFKKDHIAWESEPLLAILTQEDDYQMDAFPKMNYITLDASEVQFTVKKVWENDENMPHLRSVYITAEIYKDDEFDHLIRLDESNDWTYSWTGDPGADWFVIEQEVPNDYVVVYRKQGVEYVIVNTYTPGGGSSWIETYYEGEETTTAPHETGDHFEGSETTTLPSGLITSDVETTTTDKTIHSEQTQTTTTTATNTTDTTTSSSGSETTSTTTTTTTTTKTPGSGSGSYSGGGSSSSSRYSSGGGSSSSSNSSKTPSSGSGSASSSGNSSKITKLPQTGQLWWPVVPLAAGGVLLMGIGLKLKEKDHDT